MQWHNRTVRAIAEMICGNFDADKTLFVYRSSSYLTEFFEDADTDYTHDGSTRWAWVASVLTDILNEPHQDALTPPDTFCRIIRVLMDPADARNEGSDRPGALAALNAALAREGFEAFYAEDKICYLRHIGTKKVAGVATSPHRPLSAAEVLRRQQLAAYLNMCSEDELIGDLLVPMFRHIGFHRIMARDHKDKALEYGKDVWMRFRLPTQHYLYFGIQAKKGKLDAAGTTRSSNANIAEIHAQAVMMLGHEVFDPETNKKVLVDHAIIVAGGEITQAARQWLGDRLNASQRSQIIFMDRNDILNIHVVNNAPLPERALPKKANSLDDDIPF